MSESVKTYYPEGTLMREEYLNDAGQLHREGRPAYIEYRPDGSVMRRSYYLHGKLHREGGPATIEYQRDGSVLYGSYYQNDDEVQCLTEADLTAILRYG
tara:strand:- start:46208 stop:46504 length:297 start_codon:yes stop_codon:yes gene_type:complete